MSEYYNRHNRLASACSLSNLSPISDRLLKEIRMRSPSNARNGLLYLIQCCQVIAFLFLLIDGPKIGLKLLNEQAEASLLCLLQYSLIGNPNQYAGNPREIRLSFNIVYYFRNFLFLWQCQLISFHYLLVMQWSESVINK